MNLLVKLVLSVGTAIKAYFGAKIKERIGETMRLDYSCRISSLTKHFKDKLAFNSKPLAVLFFFFFTINMFIPGFVWAGQDGLVFNAKLGHYKDLSYDALSDKGLSWKERTQLFGGETVHYGRLTDAQRLGKQKELEALLEAIRMRETSNWADPKLAERVETEIYTWLDAHIQNVPEKYAEANIYRLRTGAVGFFRAYEIFGDEKYLEAGLNRADVILKAQWPKGHWPWGTRLGENFVRIQDGFNNEPFWIMLYAYKLSGDKKYIESAKRCADVLLSLQRRNGGWPDQWSFNGRSSGHSGVMHGVSFNDNATNSCVQMMVVMYHMTSDKKYIVRLSELGKFVAKSRMGEGILVGWCE